jgi:hypothetical protein
MYEKIGETLRLCAYMCIIVITAEASVVLIRSNWFVSTPLINSASITQNPPQNSPQPQRSEPYPGMKVSYPDIDWVKNGRTLLFVLSTQCGYCAASTGFYKEAVKAQQSRKDIHFVAMFPQEIKQSEKYLKDNGIEIKDVKQSMPFAVGASGFPTLLLVNNTGTVEKAWIGKLPGDQEQDVLASIK